MSMNYENMAVVQGWADTRSALRRWSVRPGRALLPWSLGSLAIAALLIVATWVIATHSTPDVTAVYFPGLYFTSTLGDFGFILYRNGLVLALHGFACVAGFIAGSSVPLEAQRHTGFAKTLHDKAGPFAIAFVIGATSFSLATQAYVLGSAASTLAAQGHMNVGLLVVGLLPHAGLELIGLFLPLAAWIVASHRGDWHELLAATFVTVGIAIPMLIAAAFIEVYVSPDVILWLRG